MFAAIGRLFSFPLLAKDLIERAARKRTYVTRALVGCVLTGAFALAALKTQSGNGFSPDSTFGDYYLLGIGHTLFARLVEALGCSLVLMQPFLMAGAFTIEKERGSMELIILTNLSSGKLLLEKYLSGLIPMATLLLFALPLGSIAYSYGGVSPAEFQIACIILAGAWLQTSAVALFCSAWFRTTLSATVASYVLLALMYVASAFFLSTAFLKSGFPSYFEVFNVVTLNPLGLMSDTSGSRWLRDSGITMPGMTGGFSSSTSIGFGVTLPIYVSAGFFLLLARLALPRRALPNSFKVPSRIFQRLDRLFLSINRKFGDVQVDRSRLQRLENNPILWLEARRGKFGRLHHLIRIGVGFAAVISIILTIDSTPATLSTLIVLLTGLIVLNLAMRSASLIPYERSRQTLDTLLSTPLPTASIIRNKMRPIQWLSIALIIPLILVVLGNACAQSRGGFSITYVLFACVAICIFSVEARWIGAWFGTRVLSKEKALAFSLCAIVALILGPLFIAFLLNAAYRDYFALFNYLSSLSPLFLLCLNEWGAFEHMVGETQLNDGIPSLQFAIAALSLHLVVALLLRRRCFLDAERLLRRT